MTTTDPICLGEGGSTPEREPVGEMANKSISAASLVKHFPKSSEN
jgi:hypothetical protein